MTHRSLNTLQKRDLCFAIRDAVAAARSEGAETIAKELEALLTALQPKATQAH